MTLTFPLGFLAAQGGPLSVTSYTGSISASVAGSTVKFTATAPIPAGQLIVITGMASSTSRTLLSAADTPGNVWTADATVTRAGLPSLNAYIASGYLAVGLGIGDIITLTFNAGMGVNSGFSLMGVTNGQASSPLDKVATGSGNSTTPSSPTAATTQAKEIVFGVLCSEGTHVFTPDATYTAIGNSIVGGDARLANGYKILSVTGAQDYGGSMSGSENWVEATATYKGN